MSIDALVRRAWTIPVSCALQLLSVVAAFLPWVRTGEAQRSSFRLLRDLNELGVLRGELAGSARIAWVLLPALAAGSVLLHALAWHRVAAVVGTVGALIVLGGALAVTTAPVAELLGARVALLLAPFSLVFSLVTARRDPVAAEGAVGAEAVAAT